MFLLFLPPSVLPLFRYPLIIQLENHCNVENQKLIAKSLTQILGEAIWVPKKEGKPFTASTTSPSLLKNKILIEASHSYFHSSPFLLPFTVSLSLLCPSFSPTCLQSLVASTLSFSTLNHPSSFFISFLVSYIHTLTFPSSFSPHSSSFSIFLAYLDHSFSLIHSYITLKLLQRNR